MVDTLTDDHRQEVILVDADGDLQALDAIGALRGGGVLDVSRDGTSLIAGGTERRRLRAAPLTYVHRDLGTVTSPFEPYAAALDPSGRRAVALVMRFDPTAQAELVVWDPLADEHWVIAAVDHQAEVTWVDGDRVVVWLPTTWSVTSTLDR